MSNRGKHTFDAYDVAIVSVLAFLFFVGLIGLGAGFVIMVDGVTAPVCHERSLQ